ncbi:hypothetical protein BJY52DRAFT_1233391 [Lactarius psammicola]|nr:hypothetical protein BJY52DRAFT_1233391 [Lactarius psammicola]
MWLVASASAVSMVMTLIMTSVWSAGIPTLSTASLMVDLKDSDCSLSDSDVLFWRSTGPSASLETISSPRYEIGVLIV